MSRLIQFAMMLILSSFMAYAFANDLALDGFNRRFTLVKNDEGKITTIKLKKAVTQFTLRPFLEQIKSDLMMEQNTLKGMNASEREAEIDAMLADMGLDPYAKDGQGAEEARKVKESLLAIDSINVEATFFELDKKDFWKEFEAKLNEAFKFIDPTILANLEDPRFFYKRNVTYTVINWALNEAKKRFSNIPVLNIASFVIVRVHDMMLEQRYFHHNMLLHYFETIPETKLGMSKEDVDRTVSSIYEYRISATNLPESNRAARDWLNYGMNIFYQSVRAGNTRMTSWQGPLSTMNFKDVKKINFAFAEVMNGDAKMIYHLHTNAHMFSKKPALGYDYSQPNKVKRQRALLNLASVALGFVKIPDWIKGNVENFIKSAYVEQVRLEGALVGHFESQGNVPMIKNVYAQRANFYIVE